MGEVFPLGVFVVVGFPEGGAFVFDAAADGLPSPVVLVLVATVVLDFVVVPDFAVVLDLTALVGLLVFFTAELSAVGRVDGFALFGREPIVLPGSFLAAALVPAGLVLVESLVVLPVFFFRGSTPSFFPLGLGHFCGLWGISGVVEAELVDSGVGDGLSDVFESSGMTAGETSGSFGGTSPSLGRTCASLAGISASPGGTSESLGGTS